MRRMVAEEARIMLATYPVDLQSPPTQGAKPVWFDLFEPTDDERATVEKAIGVTLPSREQLSEVESSSRASIEDGVLFFSMPVMTREPGTEHLPSPLGIVLSTDMLVTIRYAHLHSIEYMSAKLNRKKETIGSVELFVRLVEAVVDYGADLLEDLAAQLDRISRSVFRRGRRRQRVKRTSLRLRNTLLDIGETGERLSQIRDTLLGLQRIVLFVCDRGLEWFPQDVHGRVLTARNDLASLADYEMHLYGKVQFLLDAVLGFISTEQNDIFRVLTVVSVIGIPPVMIASLYGMNFKNMPELNWEWGYPMALTAIALGAILPAVWFKRRGWW